MPGFTTSFLFPDLNVWVALTHARHVHHEVASDWLADLDADIRLVFCRFTQLGFFRLMTAAAIMGEDTMTQAEAWSIYDRWLAKDHVLFVDEPAGLDVRFRALSRSKHASPQAWGDGYLAAFAEVSQFSLVTFDRGLAKRSHAVILLGE